MASSSYISNSHPFSIEPFIVDEDFDDDSDALEPFIIGTASVLPNDNITHS